MAKQAFRLLNEESSCVFKLMESTCFVTLFHCLVIFVHVVEITELSKSKFKRDSKGFVGQHLLHIMSVHTGHNLGPVEEPRHWLKYGGLGLARRQTVLSCSEVYLCLLHRDASSPQQINWFVDDSN